MKNKAKQVLSIVLYGIPLLFATLVVQPMGLLVAFLAVAAVLILLHHEERLPQRLRPPEALWPGLSLGAALTITMHQAAGYFATGAFGGSMPELLASYRMFGFHPNWRTVLFSTIMMVVLITWPRKFPKLSKTLPAGFVGIVATTALNLLLNPVAARTVVPELVPDWLPFFHRMPTSVLSMLLIFVAWEHIPFGRIKTLFAHRNPLQILLFLALVGTMFWFSMLWVLAGAALVWGACCLYRLLRPKETTP